MDVRITPCTLLRMFSLCGLRTAEQPAVTGVKSPFTRTAVGRSVGGLLSSRKLPRNGLGEINGDFLEADFSVVIVSQ
jgi:hypothetical protein